MEIAGGIYIMIFVPHNRRSIRLPGFDYSMPGRYFLTICSHEHKRLFGEIINGQIILNEFGRIIETEWLKSPEIRNEIKLDTYIIMPNHIHAIVIITNDANIDRYYPDVGADGRLPLRENNPRKFQNMGSHSIPSLVAGFKSSVTTQINKIRKIPECPVWQRNYYENIVRNKYSLDRIRRYIIENPVKWKNDGNNIW